MWLLYNSETGEQIGDWLPDMPALGPGQAAVRVPGSAKTGMTEWDPGDRGFVEVMALDAQGIWNLFTGDEKMAICLSQIPEVDALVKALPFASMTRRTDPWHAAGVQLLQGVGLLTAERAAQVLAFQRPLPVSAQP